jgi:hypothetical protein
MMATYDVHFKTTADLYQAECESLLSDFAQKMIDELIEYGVPPENVWQQSALEVDIRYWTENTDYDQQAVALDFGEDRPRDEDYEW